MAGPAFTVRYGPIDGEAGGTVGDFLDDVPPGAVVVIDNGGPKWPGRSTGPTPGSPPSGALAAIRAGMTTPEYYGLEERGLKIRN